MMERDDPAKFWKRHAHRYRQMARRWKAEYLAAMDDRESERARRIAADLQAELDELRDAVINDPEAARRALLERMTRGPA